METLGYLAALAAASSWAFSGLLVVGPVRTLGTITFNTLRMASVAVMLTVYVLFQESSQLPEFKYLMQLMLSGFIGIYLGDTFLFGCIKRLGPRIAGLLFAANAPISFMIGLIWFDETYQMVNVVGIVFVTGGVLLALAYRSQSGSHAWEQSVGKVSEGVLAGLLAALCQSLGTFIALDAMMAGTDPVMATATRVWVAAVFLFLTLWIRNGKRVFAVYNGITLNMVSRIVGSGVIGMGIGMSLLLWAIKVAPVGIVATLSATTPVLLLPMVWILTRERPRSASLWAAVFVVIGVALVFTHN